MVDNANLKKVVFIIGVMAVLFRPVLSYAWMDDRHDRHDRHDGHYRYHEHPRYGMRIEVISNDYVPVIVSGANYYYYDGLYYAPTANGYVIIAPPVGAIVPAIPPEYRPVIINGRTYYTDSGVYYVYTRYGYRVVMPPAVQAVGQPVVVAQPGQVVARPQTQTKVAEGMGLGGILGALTGGIIGHQMKGHHEVGGALIGGVAGAAAGGIVGAQIPNQNASTPAATAQPAAPYVVQAQPAAPTTQGPPDEAVTINVPNDQGGYTPVTLRRSGSGYVGPQGEYYPEFPKVSQLKVLYSK